MLIDPNTAKTLADWLNSPAVTENSDPALEFEGESLSYAELAQRARRVANALTASGVKAEERVGILAKNSSAYVETLLGCSLIGAVPVGVNWRLAPPEVAYILEDSRVGVLMCGEEFAGMIDSIREQLPSLKQAIAMGFDHEQWERFDHWRDRASDESPEHQCRADDTLIQLYTSGTTGHPKGVELSHNNVLHTLRAMLKDGWFDWTEKDINLVCMPMFHVAGSNWALLGLTAGCRNIVMAEPNPVRILELFEQERVTRAILVPALILFLLQTPGVETTDLSSCRQITYGASPIPADLLKKAMEVFDCDFIQLYGMTETSGYTCCMVPEVHRRGGDVLRSCGRPCSDVEVQMQDENGDEVPVGEIGEIVTRAPSVMKGYWRLPEETASSYRNGWFRTGDAGYRNEEGFVFIHDRIGDMIISGGENIYPAEVESALFAHPAIADVGIVSRPDDRWGESVHAVLVKAPDSAELSLTELQTFARKSLAGYKIPKSLEYIDALPRNPSGKILRRQLREKFWQGKERRIN